MDLEGHSGGRDFILYDFVRNSRLYDTCREKMHVNSYS